VKELKSKIHVKRYILGGIAHYKLKIWYRIWGIL